MKIIFMGTPEFSIPSLEKIYEKYGVEAIFTKVDKPNTRGGKIKFTPVKEFAIKNNIKIYQPDKLKNKETIKLIKDLKPDLIVVVAYGKIIPNEIIEIPKYGIINVHSSILPKFRGAAPINAAIVAGEKETGVTIMYIGEELDTGNIIKIKTTPIYEEDNFLTLHDRLKIIGGEALMEAIEEIFKGTASNIEQKHSEATFVKPFKKEDCKIDWSKSSEEIYDFVRGMTPFPGVFTYINEKLLKIIEVKKNSEITYNGMIGEVVGSLRNEGFVIKTKNSSVILTKIKPENKRVISGGDSINSKLLKIGDIIK
ncbi:MAG: methionyl-tRNA formyltransferase [Fusobacteriaceae bacterium]